MLAFITWLIWGEVPLCLQVDKNATLTPHSFAVIPMNKYRGELLREE